MTRSLLLGGALGPEGGYLIGVQSDKTNPNFRDQAVLAARDAEAHPAASSNAKDSNTADLNAMSHDAARTANVDPDRIVPANDHPVSER